MDREILIVAMILLFYFHLGSPIYYYCVPFPFAEHDIFLT